MALDIKKIAQSGQFSDEAMRKLVEQGFMDAPPDFELELDDPEPVVGGLVLCWPGPLELPKRSLAVVAARERRWLRKQALAESPEPVAAATDVLEPWIDHPEPDCAPGGSFVPLWVVYVSLALLFAVLAFAVTTGGGKSGLVY